MSTDSLPEPDTTRWRYKLDIALDAIKIGAPVGAARESAVDRKAFAEKIFDELDELHPGWQFEVPMRKQVSLQSREKEARCLIVTMFYWAHDWTKAKLARAFGVSDSTINFDIIRGERRLLNPKNGRWPELTAYELRYPIRIPTSMQMPNWRPHDHNHLSFGFLEEDFEPEEKRRARRRKALTRAVYNGDR